ncbi:hypothetical protein QQ045_018162 [Rhodiola kirilowii]
MPKFFSSLIKPFFKSNSEVGVDLERIAAQQQKSFAYGTLAHATNDFHTTKKLGEGGFGPVFKGALQDGRVIAVKKLSRTSKQGAKEFMIEAKLLSSVQHRNIVNLLGYCTHGEEKLLVYEYVVNESLDKILFKSNRRGELDWKRRHDIITGISRGILYLHEDSHSCIIHRDIKASNILLDDKWIPKIADFGLARLFTNEDFTHVVTRVAGTNGYMAPEYVMHGKLSTKADVFSFGVLVLELISGKKNSTFNLSHDSQNLIEWAWHLFKSNKSLDIMDPLIASSANMEQVSICIHIGLLCVQGDPNRRPSMSRVMVMLLKKPGSLEDPERPGYSRSRTSHAPKTGASSSTAKTSSGDSSSGQPFGSTSNTASRTISPAASPRQVRRRPNTNPATHSQSLRTRPRPDHHGKRPIQD